MTDRPLHEQQDELDVMLEALRQSQARLVVEMNHAAAALGHPSVPTIPMRMMRPKDDLLHIEVAALRRAAELNEKLLNSLFHWVLLTSAIVTGLLIVVLAQGLQ